VTLTFSVDQFQGQLHFQKFRPHHPHHPHLEGKMTIVGWLTGLQDEPHFELIVRAYLLTAEPAVTTEPALTAEPCSR
jgi:hypothetical protein